MAKQRRREDKDPRPKRRRPKDRDPKKVKPKDRDRPTATSELKESGKFPQDIRQAPAAQQSGLNPQDYPDDAATFGTGPAEAVAYHYSRQDLYAEQYAQEQLAAMQNKGAATAKVPGPGQIGVSYG